MNSRDLCTDFSTFKAALMCAVVVFGYPLTNFALHIDGELLSALQSFNGDIALGRWGTALLHATILPQIFVPFFTPALSVVLWSACAVVASRALNLSPTLRTAFVALYVSLPAFAYQLEFPFQSDCVAFGVLCATISWIYLQNALMQANKRVSSALAGVILLTFGISFYQSILFIPSTLALVSCSRSAADGTLSSRAISLLLIRLFLLMGLSYGLCLSIGVLVRTIMAIPHASWMSGMVAWGRVPTSTALPAAMSAFVQTLFGGIYYGNGIYLTCWLEVGFILIMLWSARASMKAFITTLILLTATVSEPFAAIGLLGQDQAARTYLAQSISFSGISTIALSRVPSLSPILRTIFVGLSVAYGSYHVSSLFFADTISYQADFALGSRIVSELYRADPVMDERVTPVFFLGPYMPPNVWKRADYGVFGASFFAWDGGNPNRIISFLKAAGLADLHPPTDRQAADVRQEVQKLPDWPNIGSVKLIRGVLVVHLGL